MADFPRSLLEFQRHFPDPAACAAWLTAQRWPGGFVCPACASVRGWALATKAWTFECAACHRQTSVTAGTVLHGSKLPLTVWFWAAYLMPIFDSWGRREGVKAADFLGSGAVRAQNVVPRREEILLDLWRLWRDFVRAIWRRACTSAKRSPADASISRSPRAGGSAARSTSG
jgi:hypothetical protein